MLNGTGYRTQAEISRTLESERHKIWLSPNHLHARTFTQALCIALQCATTITDQIEITDVSTLQLLRNFTQSSACRAVKELSHYQVTVPRPDMLADIHAATSGSG